MEINQLIYFKALYKEGSFVKAARYCSVSQPSLSAQIKKLESELGETLFSRSRKGCALTEAGEVFWGQAEKILDLWSETANLFSHRNEIHQEVIRVGAIPTIAPYLIPHNIDRLRDRLPNVKIDLSEDKTKELIQKVLDEEVSFGICSNLPVVPSGIQTELLFKEDLIVIFPQLPRYKEVKSLEGLEDESMILLRGGHCLSDQVVSQCRAMNVNSIESMRCESVETLVGLVESGLGYGMVPEMSLKHYRHRNIRISDSKLVKLERQVNIIVKSGRKFSSQEKQFIKSIQP